MDTSDIPYEQWKERLLDPENAAWLERALGCLPPKPLVEVFQSQFRRNDNSILLITGKERNLKAEDILTKLEKIRQSKPEVLETLVSFWLDLVGDYLDSEGMNKATRELLTVIAWLWSVSPNASVSPWDVFETLATRCTDAENGRTRLERQLEEVRTEFQKQFEEAEKALATSSEQVQQQQEAQQALSSQLADKQQTLDDQSIHISELEGEIQEAKEQIAQLSDAVEQKQQTIERQQAAHAQEQSGFRQQLAELQALREDLQATLDEANECNENLTNERDDLAIQLEDLYQITDIEELQNSLIINYEKLSQGNDAKERLNTLIEIYRAERQTQESELLTTHTNWSELDGQALDGIFMFGLEQLLLDLTNLPIQRYLVMDSFSQETILQSLITYFHSPRLEVSRVDSAQVTKTGFSANEIIALLAREIAMCDDVIAWMKNKKDDDVVLDAVSKAFAKKTTNLNAKHVAERRKSLITEWVYLRWWELNNEVGE